MRVYYGPADVSPLDIEGRKPCRRVLYRGAGLRILDDLACEASRSGSEASIPLAGKLDRFMSSPPTNDGTRSAVSSRGRLRPPCRSRRRR